jgi:hypothetical protein
MIIDIIYIYIYIYLFVYLFIFLICRVCRPSRPDVQTEGVGQKRPRRAGLPPVPEFAEAGV